MQRNLRGGSGPPGLPDSAPMLTSLNYESGPNYSSMQYDVSKRYINSAGATGPVGEVVRKNRTTFNSGAIWSG